MKRQITSSSQQSFWEVKHKHVLLGTIKILTTYLKTVSPLAKCIYLAQCVTSD